MNLVIITNLLHIARRHAHHLENLKQSLSKMMPLTVEQVENFSDEL